MVIIKNLNKRTTQAVLDRVYKNYDVTVQLDGETLSGAFLTATPSCSYYNEVHPVEAVNDQVILTSNYWTDEGLMDIAEKVKGRNGVIEIK